MLDKINKLVEEVKELSAASAEEVEQLRIKYLSKKGSVSQLFEEFKTIANEQRNNFV